MSEFAVRGNWMEEGQGTWVLAVDPIGERLLLADADGVLQWHAISDCHLVKASTPDMPRAVIAVQPIQQQVVVPRNGLRRN